MEGIDLPKGYSLEEKTFVYLRNAQGKIILAVSREGNYQQKIKETIEQIQAVCSQI
ncbi:MAG: hypothetical protein Q8P63_00630 [Candidatus Nealsonbacteria bacterium]|nr:hypothetical protein [Candidatus Nealsonbacteria bacterium]